MKFVDVLTPFSTNSLALMMFTTKIDSKSNRNIFSITGPSWGESISHRCIPFTKASDDEFWCFLICVWTSDWANNRYASDLRWHFTHYDVTVISVQEWWKWKFIFIFIQTNSARGYANVSISHWCFAYIDSSELIMWVLTHVSLTHVCLLGCTTVVPEHLWTVCTVHTNTVSQQANIG